MPFRSLLFAACFATFVTAPLHGNERWADFSGRIVCDFYETPGPLAGFDPAKDPLCTKALTDESLLIDEKTRGLRNVVIWVSTKPTRIHPRLLRMEMDDVSLDRQDCNFSPRIVVGHAGKKIVLKNTDGTVHNTSLSASPKVLKPVFGMLLERNTGRIERSIVGPSTMPLDVTCSIHPWEKAWCLCVDNPYYVISETDGSFHLLDLPTGEELEIRIWHERTGLIKKWTGSLGLDRKQLPDIRLSQSDLK